MDDTDYIKNPNTGRLVKIGSKTHRTLVNSGVIKNKRKDPRVLYKLDKNDDVNAITKELKKNIKLKPNETIKKGVGKNAGKLMKSYKGGRYKKDEPDSDSDSDDFNSLCRKLSIEPTKKIKSKKIVKKVVIESSSDEEQSVESDESESDESSD
jgi:hypothetical protein